MWTHAIDGPLDIAIAAATFALLARGRLPVLAVVASCVGMAMLAGLR